jgi:hypothetical protein
MGDGTDTAIDAGITTGSPLDPPCTDARPPEAAASCCRDVSTLPRSAKETAVISARTLFAFGLLLQATAIGATERHADWRVQASSTFVEAYTTNDSGSVFGILCTSAERCGFYLDNRTSCDDGDSYVALLNAKAVSAPTLTCRHFDFNDGRKRQVYIVSPYDTIYRAAAESAVLAFAVGMQDGSFKVTRFSGVGFNRAAAAMRRLSSGTGRDTRDTRL